MAPCWGREPHPGLMGGRTARVRLVCDVASCGCPLLLVASLLLIVRPGAPSSVLAPSSDDLYY